MNSCEIQLYKGNHWFGVESILKAWPFKPLANHNGWSSAGVFDLACARVARTIQSSSSTAWVVLQAKRPCGFASLTLLPWDSEQLGVASARIDYLVADGSYDEQQQIKKRLLKQVLVEARQKGVRHLSVRLDASDLSSIHVLEENGFITVDGILTFALDLTKHKKTEGDCDFIIRLGTAADAEQAGELARTAYVYDRFHSDPAIKSERADQLHATWLRNACAGKTGDGVIVAEDGSGLLGFVTYALQSDTAITLGGAVGTIVLVASAKRARGRGIAYATTMAAVDWFKEQACEIVEVGTQLRNIPASRLYQKCGFRLVGSSISLRLLI
jgi:dTDP-4-amino-4,6-dideoxy-D-galactose acyltransferase